MLERALECQLLRSLAAMAVALVASICTILLAVAKPRIEDTPAVVALEVVFRADGNPTGAFVGLVVAVRLTVAC